MDSGPTRARHGIAGLALVAGLALSGCYPSAEEIQAEFDAHLAENDACEVDADCGVVYPGCPLGCFRAVRADAEEEAEAYAADLISQYEAGGSRCDYDCLTHGAPYCGDEGRCQVDPAF